MTFKAVRIIHNIITRIDFSFLAEFFRLAGIYVVECIDNDEDESPYQNKEDCFDVTIDTCGSDKAFEFGPAIDFGEIKAEINKTENIRQWDQKQQIDVLKKALEQIAISLGEPPPGGVWDILVQTYVMHDLVLHSLNLQYYFKKASFAVENAQMVFESTQRFIKPMLKNINLDESERRYLEYAQIYSKTKVNAGCKFMDQELKFPIKELADECIECINRYPEFSNLKVLLGLCYEHDPVYASKAIRALACALEEENVYCYSSHIYYWIGKQYEAYKANWDDAVKNYEASYKRKHKYKNIYKIAIAQRVAGEYEKSIDSFKCIIDKLQEKIKLNMLDPLEIEYYFKSKAMVATIYFNDLRNYLGAIEFGEDLFRNYEQLINEGHYYTQFYGESAESYRHLTSQRLDAKRVRSILYYSYHYLGLEEKALKYMNMKDHE